MEGPSGWITSPGYPNGYPHRHFCRWVIRGPPGRAVRLEFEDFDMEPGYTYNTRVNGTDVEQMSCNYDYIYVRFFSSLSITVSLKKWVLNRS